MSEADEQIAVVDYCRFRHVPVYHIPNEGKRSPRTANHLKRLGLSPGVPDLCIPVAASGYHSLYIEMKAKGGKATPLQGEWLAELRRQGMCAYVCIGADSAIALIDKYLGNQLSQ